MKKNALAISLTALTVVLSIAAWFVLPDTVVTQINSGGAASSMPKPLAVAIGFLIGVSGGIAGIFGTAEGNARNKSLIISAVGSILLIIMMIVNK